MNTWLYNITNGSLPIVIICHAAIDTAGRYVLPEFSNGGYQVVWWFMVGLYVVMAVIVVLVAGPKRLVRASRITLSPNSNSSPKS